MGLRRDDRRQEADGDHQRNSRQRQIFTQSPAACQRCKMKTEKKKRNLFNWIKLYQMLKLDRGTRPTRRFERCRYSGVCRTSSVYQQIMRSNGGEHQIFRNRSVSHQSKWESMLNWLTEFKRFGFRVSCPRPVVASNWFRTPSTKNSTYPSPFWWVPIWPPRWLTRSSAKPPSDPLVPNKAERCWTSSRPTISE